MKLNTLTSTKDFSGPMTIKSMNVSISSIHGTENKPRLKQRLHDYNTNNQTSMKKRAKTRSRIKRQKTYAQNIDKIDIWGAKEKRLNVKNQELHHDLQVNVELKSNKPFDNAHKHNANSNEKHIVSMPYIDKQKACTPIKLVRNSSVT